MAAKVFEVIIIKQRWSRVQKMNILRLDDALLGVDSDKQRGLK